MGRIRGWRRDDSYSTKTYWCPRNQNPVNNFVAVAKFSDGFWHFLVFRDGRDIIDRAYRSRREAEKRAVQWMRRHPNGVPKRR